MPARVAHALIVASCVVFRHPPETAWAGETLDDARRWTEVLTTEANRLERDGINLRVSCLCGRRMVDPRPPQWIWRALHRRTS